MNDSRSRNTRRILIVLVLMWTAFIWMNSLTPADRSGAQSGQILEWINSLLMHIGGLQISHFAVRKAAHMFEFFVLAVLWSGILHTGSSTGLRRICIPLFISVAAAAADESIQLHVPGRSGEIRDVLVDAAGAVTGIIAFRCVTALHRRYRRRTTGEI